MAAGSDPDASSVSEASGWPSETKLRAAARVLLVEAERVFQDFSSDDLRVEPITSAMASQLVVAKHYLHRRPPISYAFGLRDKNRGMVGVVTYGVPASRHLQMSACPSSPGMVLELNRLWVDDVMGKNTESWFVSRTLKMLPGRIVVSYSDPLYSHMGHVYRALNFNYAGWTDMERKTPRYDYIPLDPSRHTRDAFRTGISQRVRRIAKVKYWIVTGNKSERRTLTKLCPWPSLSWHEAPPPTADDSRLKISAREVKHG